MERDLVLFASAPCGFSTGGTSGFRTETRALQDPDGCAHPYGCRHLVLLRRGWTEMINDPKLRPAAMGAHRSPRAQVALHRYAQENKFKPLTHRLDALAEPRLPNRLEVC